MENLQTTLSTSLQHSFFITKDMRRDMVRTRLRGTVPVFLAFLARTGHTVESARPVGLDRAGKVSTRPGGPGHHFEVRAPGGTRKHLFYFRQNLANGAGLSRFLTFSKSMGHPVTFLKSTSYLLHGSGFSQIRNHILNHSAAVVQTPSGIPFRHFAPDRWNLELYGNYVRTLDIFKEYYQPDLAAAYRGNTYPVTPIDFGLGYVFEEGESSLLVAKRKAIEF